MTARARLVLLLGVSAIPFALAIVGLTHPARLNDSSSHHWVAMHIVALPVFPLLALSPWLIARRIRPWLGIAVAILGYVYAAFYTGLDVLAGIGAGLLQINEGGTGKFTLYEMADRLALVGVWAFAAATVLVSAACLHQARWRAAPGAALALTGSVLFMDNHIYWPLGVIAMLCVAIGYAGLVLAMSAQWRTHTEDTGRES